MPQYPEPPLNHGRRHLSGSERTSDSAAASGYGTAFGGDHVRQREVRRLPRRNKTEQQSNDERHHCTERNHTHVKVERDCSGQQALRNHRGSDGENRSTGEQSQCPTDR